MPELITLGPRAATDLIKSYAGIDLARVLQLMNRQGLTGQRILQMAYAAIGGANERLAQKYRNVMYVTTKPDVYYRQGEGTKRMTPKSVEFSKTDSVRGSMTGHMLQYSDYEDALTWGNKWLRDAHESDVDTDVSIVVESWEARFEYEFWNRVLNYTERPVGGGFDVGWAVGAGVSGYGTIAVPYTPPGKGFTSSHMHFLFTGTVSPASLKTLVDNAVKELRHHGHKGNLQMFVSDTDVELWSTLSNFVALQPSGFTIVTPGNTSGPIQITNGLNTGVPGDLFGYLNTTRGIVELRSYEEIPTGYFWMTKSYGDNNVNNGVAMFLHPDTPFGLTPHPQIIHQEVPVLDKIKLEATHGIGTWKRTNGVAGYFANSATKYENPSL